MQRPEAGDTAAILLIGDEILSGMVEDTNARHLVRELRALGVRVRRIVVVPDEVEDIATAVRDLAAGFDHVFTSGGVGPTHDDRTMAGVARAFGTRVVRDPLLERLLRGHFGERLTEAILRMAEVPEGAVLVGDERATWPVPACRNVYILPGVPEIFRRKFDAIKERFRQAPFHRRCVYVHWEEGPLAPLLDRVVADWPQVQVGSYPTFAAADHRVKVSMDGKSADAVAGAVGALLGLLPPDAIARVE